MLFEVIIFCASAVLFFIARQWWRIKRSGIKYLPYKFPFGHLDKVLRREMSFGLAMNEFYKESEERLAGVYLTVEPGVLVRDPEILKMILTTHFEYFSDRGYCPDKEKNPVASNIFSMQVDEWKPLRSKLTPAFSSLKLKQMMAQIQGIGKNLGDRLEELVKDEKPVSIPMKDLSTRFILDVLGSTVFGIESTCITDDEQPLRKFLKTMSSLRQNEFIESLRLVFFLLWPRLMYFVGMQRLPQFAADFFINLVRKTFQFREDHNFVRHDLMQQLLQLRNTGNLDKDTSNTNKNQSHGPFLSIEECASNVFLFLMAGSETSTSSICFCLYELRRQPQHLKTLQEEIDRVLKAHNGEITYEALAEMKFLEKCILETLRIYPALPILNRRCTKEFKLPGTDQIIYKGQSVIIPIRSIQTDPKYYPNPLKFNPNRTDPEDPDYSPVTSYPFGDGPKTCIAFRMGTVMVKTGLVTILSKFNLDLSTKEADIKFTLGNLGMPPSNDFSVRLSRR